MGFIEDLRKQNAEKAEAQRVAEEKRKLNEIEYAKKRSIYEAEQQRLEKQRPSDKREYWQRAKTHFEQSGLRVMLNELVSMKAVDLIVEDKSNLDEQCPWGPSRSWKKGDTFRSFFTIELGLVGGRGSISINTNVDGEIIFNGGKDYNQSSPDRSRIPKAKWVNNRDVLEEELGRVYRRPQYYSGYIPDNPPVKDINS